MIQKRTDYHVAAFIFTLALLLLSCGGATAAQLANWHGSMGTETVREQHYTFHVEQDSNVAMTFTCAPTLTSQYTEIILLDRYNKRMDRRYAMESPTRHTYHLAPGDYIIMVGKYRSDLYGDYVLRLEATVASPGTTENEHNDQKESASIVNGHSIFGSIGYWYDSHTMDKADWFVVSFETGGEVEIRTECSESMNTQYAVMELYDSRDNRLFSKSSLGSGNTGKVTLPEGGLYYVLVWSPRTDHFGSYEIHFITEGGGQAPEEFTYTIKNPGADDAMRYITARSNIRVRTEGAFTFWQPETGGPTEGQTTPGVLIYHFELPHPAATVTLFATTITFHWNYSQGHALLYVSRDGTSWNKIAEAAPPEFGSYNQGVFNGDLSDFLAGSRDIYVKALLYAYGPDAKNGGAYTNTAEHSRYDSNRDNVTFELKVKYNSHTASTGNAEYDAETKILNVPCVEVGGAAYWGDFRLVSEFPLMLSLDDYGQLEKSGANCARYDFERHLIHVPTLRIGNDFYSMDLVLDTSSGLFHVNNVQRVIFAK
jgi:hypothetical protein